MPSIAIGDYSVELVVNGDRFIGWQSANIRWACNEVASAFSLTYSDRWNPQDQPWYITPDSECILYVDGHPVVTGYVVSSDISGDARNYTLSAEGYSKPGLLVDCSAIHKTGQWKNQPLGTIVADLVAPYGIDAIIGAGSLFREKIARFSIEDGESVAACLGRLCQMFCVVMKSNRDGALVIEYTPVAQKLELPVDPIDFSLKMDNSQRFSYYVAKGQLAGSDNFYGTGTVLQEFAAQDEGVHLFKPFIVDAKGPGGKKFLEARAVFERNTRMGQSRVITLRVKGPYDAKGKLWQPGATVDYENTLLGISGEMCILSVDMTLDSSGFITTLELVPPSTFDMVELPQSAWRKKKGRK